MNSFFNLMCRSLILGVAAFVALMMCSGCKRTGNTTDQHEVDRLENTMQEAFAKKDPQLLLDQYYWEGTSDNDKAGMSETVSNFVVTGTLIKVSFVTNINGFVASGAYRPNLPIVGSLHAEIGFDQLKIVNDFPVGQTNGRLWIPGGGSSSLIPESAK
jgi:hypothetical protein